MAPDPATARGVAPSGVHTERTENRARRLSPHLRALGWKPTKATLTQSDRAGPAYPFRGSADNPDDTVKSLERTPPSESLTAAVRPGETLHWSVDLLRDRLHSLYANDGPPDAARMLG